jgi:putative ABC transport system permease protein
MNRLDLLNLARKNLWRRKARTILTVLGVMIGTTAIVVMLSLGIGLDENQRRNMERWGSLNTIRVNQGMSYDNEGNPLGEEKRLNDEAVEEIRAIPGVVAVSPAYDAGGEARFGRKRGHIQLIGIDPAVMPDFEFKTETGRLLEPDDKNVMVVGRQVINNFRDESELRRLQRDRGRMGGMRMMREENDPLEIMDQRVSMTIYGGGDRNKKRIFNFQVVGILEGDYNENSYQAYAPIEDIKRMRQFMMQGSGSATGVQREMMIKASGGGVMRTSQSSRSSRDEADDYSYILVRTKDVSDSKEVSMILKERGYNSWSMADQLEGIEKTSRTIQAILGGLGGITLLVAALGITNTMIMAIYERTREIGIMKVIGATFSDIHGMFLTEAGLIGFFGGVIGLGLSYLVSYVINGISRDYLNQGMPPGTEEVVGISLIPPWLAIFAMIFAIMVGVLAGLYPASRAVHLSPINAIRND